MLQNIYILSPLNRATNVLGFDVLGMLLNTDTAVFERIYYHMLETDLKKILFLRENSSATL